MKEDYALLLSPPVNFAVVQLPERNFPGVVVQADTLNNFHMILMRALVAVAEGDSDEASAELEYMFEAGRREGASRIYLRRSRNRAALSRGRPWRGGARLTVIAHLAHEVAGRGSAW